LRDISSRLLRITWLRLRRVIRVRVRDRVGAEGGVGADVVVEAVQEAEAEEDKEDGEAEGVVVAGGAEDRTRGVEVIRMRPEQGAMTRR